MQKGRLMRWEDERYVRLYTRDTVTWKLLPWQAKALLPLMLRKLDRVGVVDLGGEDSVDAVTALVELPREVVAVGLEALLKRDVSRLVDGALILPKFLDAQETASSDRLRKAESRARAHDIAISAHLVTKRDDESQNVTKSHERSQVVTPNLTEPCLTEPYLTNQPPPPTPSADKQPVVAAKDFWFGEDCFPATPDGCWALIQHTREMHRFTREGARPPGFDDWATQAIRAHELDRIQFVYQDYLKDKSIRAKGHPTAVFIGRVWDVRRPERVDPGAQLRVVPKEAVCSVPGCPKPSGGDCWGRPLCYPHWGALRAHPLEKLGRVATDSEWDAFVADIQRTGTG